MKVLLLHDYYQNRGGEDVAFEREAEVLEATPGVTVVRWTKHNDAIRTLGAFGRARLLTTNAWSRSAAREVGDLIARERPDVLHAHNLWPLLSPSVLARARDLGVPTVFTAHNYYLFCLNGLFHRDGAICTECFGRTPWPGVRHACYRGISGSLTRTLGMLVHRRARVFARVDRILTPTEFARGHFLRAGFAGERVVAKPLSVADPLHGAAAAAPPLPETAHFVFASRLVPEKGGHVLLASLAAMRTQARLTIAGSGPEEGALRAACRDLGLEDRVAFVGQVDGARVRDLIASATATVVPSTWFETFGFTTIEAYALARPVVASDLGALRETVEHEVTGLRCEPGDPASLAAALDRLATERAFATRLGAQARQRYERLYTPDCNRERLLAIYASVVAERSR